MSSRSIEYTGWSTKELQNWLDAHNIPYPSQSPSPADLQAAVKAHWDSAFSWSSDQYGKAQVAFATLKADAFDTWDESRLREFLLEQGVVNPSGPREQLALLAKQKWRQYSSVASVYSKSASRSASSLSSTASKQASTAMFGDSWYQASKSASSIMAQATNHVGKTLDDTKDYVYSRREPFSQPLCMCADDIAAGTTSGSVLTSRSMASSSLPPHLARSCWPG